MRRPSHHERGSALLTAMGVALVMLVMVVGILSYAGLERSRATRQSKTLDRVSCAQAGLQIARRYFAANLSNWNTYLSDPSNYNPVPSAGNPNPAKPTDPVQGPALQTAHPELFYDLDGDGNADVYIYVRDNQDELPPATNDWGHDNDQNVFVGAVCISKTMVPLRSDGEPPRDQLTAESLLSYNTPGNTYKSQAGGGASGNGNIN